MKILYVTNYSGMYGANRSMLDLIYTLKKLNGFEAMVICPTSGLLTEYLNSSNIQNFQIPFYNWFNQRGLKGFIKYFRYKLINFFLAKKAFKLFEIKDISIVHSNTSVTDFGQKIASKLNVPHIWHVREFGKLDYNMSYFWGDKRAHKMIFNKSKKVISVSKLIYENLSYIEDEKIKIVYDGILLPNSSKKITLKSDCKISICLVGLIQPAKNQLISLKAIDHLVNVIGYKDIILDFIGGGDEHYINQLLDYCHEKKISKYVNFLGYKENVLDIIESYDLGLLTSLKEGYGRVVIEYMLKGVIPIITSSSGASEIIENRTTGFIYEPEKFTEIAQLIYYLSENIDLQMTIKKNARKIAEEIYSIESSSHQIYQIYSEIIKEELL